MDSRTMDIQLGRPFREYLHDRRLARRHTDKMDRWSLGRRQRQAHARNTDFATLTLVATDSRMAAQSRSRIHCLAASQEPPTAITAGSRSHTSRLLRLMPPVGTKVGEKARNVVASTRNARVPPMPSAGKNLHCVD